MSEEIYEFYKTNEHFRDYVDRYCKCRDKGLFEALMDLIVKTVANDYKVRMMGVCK